MRKFIIPLLLSFVTLTISAQSEAEAKKEEKTASVKKANAKEAKKSAKEAKKEAKKKAEKEELENMGKTDGHIYIYACSFEFGDSIVYFSPIEKVDSISLTKKTKFLPYRSDFSQQFKDKIEHSKFIAKNQTTSVFFAEKKNQLAKVYAKMKKRYFTKEKMRIVLIDEADFKFVHPLDYYSEPSN